MKRKLNKEEKKLSEKGLKRNQEMLQKLSDNLDYNCELIDKQSYARGFDDKWRQYLRDQKDEQDDKVIKAIRNEKEQTELIIGDLNKQLKDGVEVKTPLGIN